MLKIPILFYICLFYDVVISITELPEFDVCDVAVLEDVINSVTEEHENTNFALHKLISLSKRLSTDFCYSTPECPKKIEIQEKKTSSPQFRLPSSCSDALHPGDPDGIHLLFCPGFGVKPFYAFCMQDPEGNGSAWTVILKRQDKTVDFDRYFESYRSGFGPLTGTHWLGLDPIHAMTYFQPHELWIKLANTDKEGYARYSHFSIRSRTYDYELNAITGFYGNLSDGLSLHGGYRFSVRNRDFSELKCASKREGAWWFYETPLESRLCCHSHLNGVYGIWNQDKNPAGVAWENLSNTPIHYVLMAIRPRN